ncbi:hypothetical protein ACWXWU_13470 [Shewanella sp. A14]
MLFFITFTIVAIYFAVGYHKGLIKLASESKQEQLKVFGKAYSSHKELYGDFNFMSDVFSGEKISEEHDKQIRQRLVLLRRKLIGQIIFGLLAFFSVVAQSALN